MSSTSTRSGAARGLRACLLVLGLACVALSLVATVRGRNELVVPIVLAAIYGGAWFVAGSSLGGRGIVRGAFTSLVVLSVIAVLPEMALRASSFRHQSGIEFGWPRPQHFQKLVKDERLLWTLDPNREGVNSLGFPGDEIAPKDAGAFRILYLGDSCTFEDAPVVPYTRRLQDRLRATRENGARMEYVTLALPGYTSHQGRILAEDYGAMVDPDLVVVYYGWNDHWLAYGAIDSEKVMEDSARTRALEWAHARVRLVQAVSYLRDARRERPASVSGRPRVPLEEYRDNLVAIVRRFEELDVPVILITAPTSHRNVGVPDYLVDLDFVVDRASAVSIHTDYTDVVREVAASEGTYLLDLEEAFNAMEPERLEQLMMVDGIHFSDAGAKEAAARLDLFLAEQLEL
jgi:lysophospholipase L1-like esterase